MCASVLSSPLPQSGFEAPAAQVSASVMALSLEWQSLGINHFAEDCFSYLGSFLVPCELRIFFFFFSVKNAVGILIGIVLLL